MSRYRETMAKILYPNGDETLFKVDAITSAYQVGFGSQFHVSMHPLTAGEARKYEVDHEKDEEDFSMEDVSCLKLAVPAGYVLRPASDEPNDWRVVRDPARDPLKVERVIFSKPATIVIWHDGTKTIVKCDKMDKYSKATGLALCFMKKALGNSSRGLNDALREANERAVVETEHEKLMKKAKKYQKKGEAQKADDKQMKQQKDIHVVTETDDNLTEELNRKYRCLLVMNELHGGYTGHDTVKEHKK